MATRPSFIVSAHELPESIHVYPQSTEPMGPIRRAGKVAGLVRIGINLQRLPPGTRSSSRRADLKPSDWWEDAPQQTRGPHDALPNRLRSRSP